MAISHNKSTPQIICYKCDKPVDMIETEICMARRQLHYRVHCHGETDECLVDELFIVEAGHLPIGVAFKPKKLPPAHDHCRSIIHYPLRPKGKNLTVSNSIVLDGTVLVHDT